MEIVTLSVAMAGLYMAIRSVEFGLIRDGIKRVDEDVVGGAQRDIKQGKVRSAFVEVMELNASMRGTQYQFGRHTGLRLPPDPRPIHDRSAWARQTLLRQIIPTYVAIDLINNCLIRSPAVHSVATGQLHFSELDVLHKIVIKYVTASLVPLYISLAYDVTSVVAVLALGMAPCDWPPAFGNPWFAGSLHEFWSVHWHQVSIFPKNCASGSCLTSLTSRF